MQALLGPLNEASNLRKAEVKAILISVRFSTPFSLNTLGRLLMRMLRIADEKVKV